MTTLRARKIYAARRKRQAQPGPFARLRRACKLWSFGHTWRFAWREAGKQVIE